MSQANVPVLVMVLDKEYRIACPEDEQSALLASANHLNQRIKEIRENGRVIGAERIAVMAALNATHELLSEQEQRRADGTNLSARLRGLNERIDRALNDDAQSMDS